MDTTRRVFMLFTAALAASAAASGRAQPDDSSFWRAFEVFADRCLAATPSPESLSVTATHLGWIPLSAAETRELAAPLGVIPGVHLAWRVPIESFVVEVGGCGMWSMERVMRARDRGEQIQGPLPNIAEEGADIRFGHSNHWTCNVHFSGGDADALVRALIHSSVRDTALGEPLTRTEELGNRPGWGDASWYIREERSAISLTYKKLAGRPHAGFTRELHLGFFTPFSGQPAAR